MYLLVARSASRAISVDQELAMNRINLGCWIVVCLTLAWLPMTLIAADGESPAPEPVTLEDPNIPVDELALLLKPLTKDQLLIEADAWQALVQAKAEEIAEAEIAVKRQNREIAKADEIIKQAESGKKQPEEVGVQADQARQTGDTAAAAKSEQAAEAPAEAMAEAKEAQKNEKLSLLEGVSELREERTMLLDQLKAVIGALETKTDQNDAETLAKIQDYKLYATAVSGIELDVKDTTSARLAIQGWVTSEEGGIRWGLNLLHFFGILLATWIISGIFSGLIHRAMKRVPGTSRLLEDFLVKAARWIVLAIGLIVALAALEISIGPLLAVVGAAGFVIAFALQDSLSNFASGMMILFFKPFDVGDVVDAGGVSGSVDSMNLVSTTIKTFDNKKMVVPNNRVWGDVITNASGVTERRVDMEFGIGYNDDIDKALGILEEIVAAHPNVLPEPAPTIRMNALADSSVNFIVRPWAKTGDYWGVYWDITREVKKRFDAEGIGIPFPQRDVHLYIAEGGEKLARLAGGAPGTLRQAEQKREDGGLDD
jgi:small conductance mechanosensitive channel